MSSINSSFLVAVPGCRAVWLTDCLFVVVALLPSEAVDLAVPKRCITPRSGAAGAWESCKGKVLSLA